MIKMIVFLECLSVFKCWSGLIRLMNTTAFRYCLASYESQDHFIIFPLVHGYGNLRTGAANHVSTNKNKNKTKWVRTHYNAYACMCVGGRGGGMFVLVLLTLSCVRKLHMMLYHLTNRTEGIVCPRKGFNRHTVFFAREKNKGIRS